MYYIKKISIFLKNIIFNYFYWSGSRYPRVIEYQDEYLKSEYPKTMNPDPNIKFTNPTDPDPNTLNFPDIRIRVPWIFRISGSVPGLPRTIAPLVEIFILTHPYKTSDPGLSVIFHLVFFYYGPKAQHIFFCFVWIYMFSGFDIL